ncbi:MAG: twin-arginine translocase subunit TatC [Sandaracinaceae bacterium]|nr:twin-arginine translocase subunit TatC [Sandaracinaceae bacterium]
MGKPLESRAAAMPPEEAKKKAAAAASAEEPEDDVEMSFLDHLRELRTRLVRALWGFIPGMALAWVMREEILQFLAEPYMHAFRSLGQGEPTLHFGNPADMFVNYMMIALICGGIFGSPWAFYQGWLFIAPGLYRSERRKAIPFVLLSTIFFVGGAFFGYRFVLPPAFDALLSFAGQVGGLRIQPTIMINEYLDFSLRMLLALGITFEVPIVIGFVSYIGLVNWKQLLEFSRWWVVIAAVLAAVLTPSGDAPTMMLVLTPLVALYYVAILFAFLVGPKPPAPTKDDEPEGKAAA